MCLGAFEASSVGAMQLQSLPAVKLAGDAAPVVPESTVEEMLEAAVIATAEASNRAIKRRVRQRLHKKLGSMLKPEEFDAAMERFKIMEAQGVNPRSAATAGIVQRQPMDSCTASAPNVCVAVACPSVQVLTLPFLMPVPASTPVIVQMPPPVMRPTPVCVQAAFPCNSKPVQQELTEVLSQTTLDEEDLESLSDVSTEWDRALSEAAPPVERTFIHFDTRPHVNHRRCRSCSV